MKPTGNVKRFLLFVLHHNDWREAVALGDMETVKAVSKMQKNAAKMGWPTGCTWQLHEGDMISALVELGKLV